MYKSYYKSKNRLFDNITVTFFQPIHIALRERLRTHEVFTVDQIVVVISYLNYHQFSIKSYVVDVY